MGVTSKCVGDRERRHGKGQTKGEEETRPPPPPGPGLRPGRGRAEPSRAATAGPAGRARAAAASGGPRSGPGTGGPVLRGGAGRRRRLPSQVRTGEQRPGGAAPLWGRAGRRLGPGGGRAGGPGEGESPEEARGVPGVGGVAACRPPAAGGSLGRGLRAPLHFAGWDGVFAGGERSPATFTVCVCVPSLCRGSRS